MPSDLRLLILQLRPEDIISESEFACVLKYGDLSVQDTHRIRVEQAGIPDNLNLEAYAAIIVGGSPFDITTPEDKKSRIQKKIEADFDNLLEKVVTQDIPFLGCCSGNGLLGKHLGAKISKQYGEALDCTTLEITEDGKEDKLLRGFPDHIDVLLGHKEAVDETPDSAVLLMTGENCPVQMFRVGQNVYATQFHPEADADEFCLRIDTYSNYGYFEPHEADGLKRSVSEKPTPYAHKILKRFVDIYYMNKV
ncbi:MAG: glutamine amidotransferase [Alphaproteobacteria bacterium]|nr:glutamine amidotransferase [Alphaproteobacteria bacterium]